MHPFILHLKQNVTHIISDWSFDGISFPPGVIFASQNNSINSYVRKKTHENYDGFFHAQYIMRTYLAFVNTYQFYMNSHNRIWLMCVIYSMILVNNNQLDWCVFSSSSSNFLYCCCHWFDRVKVNVTPKRQGNKLFLFQKIFYDYFYSR